MINFILNYIILDFEEFKNNLEEDPHPILDLINDESTDQDLLARLVDREERYQVWTNITEFILGK
jgi:nitrogen regulatory protein PII-like uncharacterized protein